MFRFKLFPVVFEEDDGAGSGTPTPVAETPTAPAAPEPATTPEPQPGPWANDLAAYIQDEAARAQADRFLREKIQPHVTQLEQQYAPARQLYDDLLQDPSTTLIAVANEIYGDEVAQALAGHLASPEEEQTSETETTDAAPVDPRVQQMLEDYEAQKRQEQYEAELARLKEQVPDLDPDDFAPFVITANGDMDAALVGYQNFMQKIQQRYAPATETPPAPAAPAVVGSEGVGSVPPPVSKQYSSFDDALNDTLAEMRANREGPTTVGSV